MYNRVLSQTELLSVEAYLASKYGLGFVSAVVLPSNDVTKLGNGTVTLSGPNTYPVKRPSSKARCWRPRTRPWAWAAATRPRSSKTAPRWA